MSLTVVTPPTAELVSIEELRAQLNLTGITEDDGLLLAYRAAAVEMLEAATQRRFVTQEVVWSLSDWPCDFRLPLAPVAIDGVVSVTYAAPSGVDQVLVEGEDFVVSPCGPTVRLRPVSGSVLPLVDDDAAEPVRIRFTVGTDPASVPATVPVAIKMLVALMYRHRGDGEAAAPQLAPSGLPAAVEALIGAERW